MNDFIPGLELSEIFYNEAVKPILQNDFPQLIYSAALIGSGSEVLGYDTEQSMDHHWGPKVMLFVTEEDYPRFAEDIKNTMSKKLPLEVHGIPTNFSKPNEIGVQILRKVEKGPVNHLVYIYKVDEYFESHLGKLPPKLTAVDWLIISEQKLLEVTAGKVFHDGLRTLTPIRDSLSYYPHDVWLYILACQWTKISQEEAFIGRCGEVGDELGSQITAMRLVRELIRLSFILERKYVPYTKWLGTAFSKLSIAANLSSILKDVLLAGDWKKREAYMSKAYEIVAMAHNALGVTKSLPTKVTSYYSRPYLVIHADEFAKATREAITDKEVLNIESNIGSVNQFIDSTDVLAKPNLTQKLKVLFE